MSNYKNTLPKVFHNKMMLETKEEATAIVGWLLEAGVSFAVTMDEPYNVWLSHEALEVVAKRTGL